MSMSEVAEYLSNGPSTTAGQSYLPFALGITIPSWSFALLTYVLRIWSRKRRNNLGWDDHLMTLAVLFAIPNLVIFYILVFRAGGKHLKDSKNIAILEEEQLLSFVLLPLTVFCMSFVKVSACLMILRIKDSKWWKMSLWTYNAIIIGFSIGATVAHLGKCQPIRSNWSILGALGGEGVCWKTNQLLTYAYILSAFFAITDLIIALLPLAFILRIRRDVKEKIMLSIVMGLGLLAAACTIAKIPLVERPFQRGNDPLWEGYKLLTLTMTEISTAIFAANLPCLRFLLRGITKALGWDRKNNTSQRYPPYAYPVAYSGYSGSTRRKRMEYDLETENMESQAYITMAPTEGPTPVPIRHDLRYEDQKMSTDVQWFDMKSEDRLNMPAHRDR